MLEADPDNDDGGTLYLIGVAAAVVFSAIISAVVVVLGELTAYLRRRCIRRESAAVLSGAED